MSGRCHLLHDLMLISLCKLLNHPIADEIREEYVILTVPGWRGGVGGGAGRGARARGEGGGGERAMPCGQTEIIKGLLDFTLVP